ncbi:dUTP diphosphatase [Oceanobacillus oncorhynchi]|uniref:dUTP diphosphatase n=1 Tax=Oceanobacillus oncorhynchi TaxID=545501 RepID=UPI0025A3E9CC|nr:deoxyuridine 5'-triphosphate nucleotidohydrolase [Oceanobacillus oncorhynchi]MDM8098676.1 deoxyuridine 5'-triphosphate nucleotidohydrolase [Oceanobacillus oncorhynchi]
MKVKKMQPDAVLPKYANENDSGFDLVAIEDVIIEPGETKLIKTGLAFDIPEGFEIQVRPRSGITLKTKLRVQFGTIDSNYRGEVGVIVDNTEENIYVRGVGYYNSIDGGFSETHGGEDILCGSYIIHKGDRIAQGILAPVSKATFIEVQELSESTRGINGYGSTGIN